MQRLWIKLWGNHKPGRSVDVSPGGQTAIVTNAHGHQNNPTVSRMSHRAHRQWLSNARRERTDNPHEAPHMPYALNTSQLDQEIEVIVYKSNAYVNIKPKSIDQGRTRLKQRVKTTC